MKKLLLLVSINVLFVINSFAALSAGDIAFVQYNADGTDDFAFVALVNIPMGEVIFFTDNGWQSDNTFRTGEGIMTWTASSNIDCGDVITLTATSGINFAGDGDQILAYQGSTASPTFIAALNNQGAATWQTTATNSHSSALPSGLTNGITAIAITEIDNAIYDATILVGTGAVVGAAINTNSAWGGDNSSNQTFVGTFDIAACVPLPVELVSFSVKKQNENINLSWQTASEENNSHFEIEHSTNGRDFTYVDKVIGNGTTAEIQNYEFVHTDAVTGKNYYRLLQVDFDGAFEYSSVEVVTVRNEVAVEIYPTMAANALQVVFDAELASEVTYQIVSVTGATVVSNELDARSEQQEISVADLSKGIYFIQFVVNGELITHRFVKI